ARGVAEVASCRGLDPERVIAERDGIEIHFEDFLLREVSLELDRGDDLLDFADRRAGGADLPRKQIPRQLHGNRRSALHIAPQRVVDGSKGSAVVDAFVLVKAMVLRR